MRILLAGDVHGDGNHLLYLYKMAEHFDADRVFALGDFGYFEHYVDGKEFLYEAQLMAEKFSKPLYWLDGNHENHLMLRQVYSDNVVDDGMWEIRPNVLHSPRGNRFTWDGVDFLTMGGAFSVDRSQRRVGKTFWFEETITPEEVAAAGTDKVDIVLSHDVPSGIDMLAIQVHRGFNYRNIPESERNRERVRQVVDAVRPDYLFHGHYHLNYMQQLKLHNAHVVSVRGLACNGMGPDSWTIIDTKDYT